MLFKVMCRFFLGYMAGLMMAAVMFVVVGVGLTALLEDVTGGAVESFINNPVVFGTLAVFAFGIFPLVCALSNAGALE